MAGAGTEPTRRVELARPVAAPWLLAAGFAAGAALLLGVRPVAAQRVIGHGVLSLAPLAAAWACLGAYRKATRGARLPWALFAWAAGAAMAGQLLWAARDLLFGLPLPFPSISFWLFVLFHPLFAAGAALALPPLRVRGYAIEIGLDALLILSAAAVVILRFVLEPLTAASPWITQTQFLALLAGQLAWVTSAFFAGLLVVWREPVIPGGAVGALAATAAVFGLGNLLVLAGVDPEPSVAGGPFDTLWLAGWGLLAIAGWKGPQAAHAAAAERPPSWLADQMRQAVVPVAVLFLAGIVIDGALRAPLDVATAGALAFMGTVLAARIYQALRAAERQAVEKRRLAHTRALVEVSHTLAGETELNKALDLVAQWACRLLGARAAGIELLSDDGETLELRASYGLSASIVGLRFPVDGSFTGWVVRNGRPRAAAHAAEDPFIQPQSLPIVGDSATAAAPLRFRDRPLGALSCLRDRPFDAEELELLGALSDQAAIAIQNARLFEQVRALSMTDPLTGLANRRQLERDLAREFAAARRGRRLVAVMFDLDGFKQYNDTQGHLAGDEVLRSFGRVLATATRAMNLAARYGGDEFVALLADSDRAGAAIFIQRVCQWFAEATQATAPGLTVSAGVAEFRP
ncbi:MAG: sensor domain-containing diguanylate cyclase, partial [Gemmatimonadetes bacterium]|nr:sensor domain-containing diguanylate cyclase [Gemmatimonadota bacterium]